MRDRLNDRYCYGGVSERSMVTVLKFYAKLSTSHFTFEIEPLCYMPKARFMREVPLCHSPSFSV